jgi:putative addiction module component (TIGR02574 family)
MSANAFRSEGSIMSECTQELLRSVLALPAIDRAALADELLSSLEPPDSAIDERWAIEAETRLAAFKAGTMKAIPAEEVFRELETQR